MADTAIIYTDKELNFLREILCALIDKSDWDNSRGNGLTVGRVLMNDRENICEDVKKIYDKLW